MKQPHLVISSLDLDRIEQLLGNHPQHLALQEELDRAEIREPADMPPDVVTMNSKVRFKMQSSGNEFASPWSTRAMPRATRATSRYWRRWAAPCSA